MKKREKKRRGFVTIFILIMMTALFLIVSAAIKANYNLHTQNMREKKELRKIMRSPGVSGERVRHFH